MIVHPIGAEVVFQGGFGDALAKETSGIGETEVAILGYEGAVDVVNVLGALTVPERGVQHHDGASVYHKANLPPEGVVEPLREVSQRPLEERPGEGDVVDGFEGG